MRHARRIGLPSALTACVVLLVLSSLAAADVDKVICVPWEGNPLSQHTAVSGVQVRLKAVVKTTDTSTIWYKWVYGDGGESAVMSTGGGTLYALEDNHTYTGAAGTPITAQLLVDDVDSSLTNAVPDQYLLKIEDDTLDARVNIAIDNGLWYLYKSRSFSGSTVYWTSIGYYAAPTAAALLAFQVNGHRETGDFDEDPYAEVVQKGLQHMFSSRLAVTGISPQVYGNPDSNGNGIGIYANSGRSLYETGAVMDAIVATGTPAAVASVGPVNIVGRTYADILQDMCDLYAYTQSDYAGAPYGGWRYSWNEAPDNSACQWAAIGMIPAEQAPWSCAVPQWVKDRNDLWLTYSYFGGTGINSRGFGYTYAGLRYSYGHATRPSGMVQMVLSVPSYKADGRWIGAESWFPDNWSWYMANRSYYGYYAFVKAMRLSATDTLSNGFNWYRGTNGLAPKLVAEQNVGSGAWPDGGVSPVGSFGVNLVTAWAIAMLRPALFQASPVASFTANPNPTYSDGLISFDPSGSGHSEPGKDINNLTLFEWDWDNDGVYDQSTPDPTIVTHSFHADVLPSTFPVTLRVTDDGDPALTATYTLNIVISNPPHPPVADADGPYIVSLCPLDSLTLDGSGSFDPDEGQFELGIDPPPPGDTITAWDWDLTPPLTGFDDESGEMVALNSTQVASYFAAGVHQIGLRVTDNTALSFPNSGEPNLTHADFTTLTVYPPCQDCLLTAQIGCHSVILTWTVPGTYDVLRSTTGPNSGFVKIGTAIGTAYADAGVTDGTTYWYRITDGQCLTAPAQITYVLDPDCLGLTCRAKSGKVQLVWPQIPGAVSYNCYRSTVPGGPYVFLANAVTTYCTYLDTTVTNGVTYFYVVRPVDSTGAEFAQSNECAATPQDRFPPPQPASVVPTITATFDYDWVYQNSPSTGHQSRLTVDLGEGAPAGCQAAVTEVGGAGDVVLEPTADPLVWTILGGQRATGAVGAIRLSIAVSDGDGLELGTVEKDITVRPLGDANGSLGVNIDDQSKILDRLNGLSGGGTVRECDLTGDGQVNIDDLAIINNILNGLSVP